MELIKEKNGQVDTEFVFLQYTSSMLDETSQNKPCVY